MPESDDLFDKYELLLPSKYSGGLLVIELYQRVRSKALGRHFTGGDMKYILEDIARRDEAQPVQPEKIIKNLLHYFLRNVPGEPGKYYLTDHAESMVELNTILQSPDDSATEMVKKFVLVFRDFGDQAEDIANAIASKDKFMRSLRTQVDGFYQQVDDFKHPENSEEGLQLAQLKANWEKAADIYLDIEEFFETVDYKIGNIRRQIHRASEKLSELHENFSSRSHFRIQVKRLYQLVLAHTAYHEQDEPFANEALVKDLVHERVKFQYPEYYDYGLSRSNDIAEQEVDAIYEKSERQAIEAEIKRQEVINLWVSECKKMLEGNQDLVLGDLLEIIMTQENDLTVAYHVAIELTQFVSEDEEHLLEILADPIHLKNTELTLWKMKMRKLQTFVS
jgi:hypothetical protein